MTRQRARTTRLVSAATWPEEGHDTAPVRAMTRGRSVRAAWVRVCALYT